MENTLENKAKFFAQYWGQRLWRYKHTNGESNLLYINAITIENKKSFGFEGYLELKSLSDITDEDAIEVAKFYYGEKHVETHPDDHFKYIRAIKESLENKLAGARSIQIIDYLRSKGYALPWMNLTVEQLISFGWIKIK